MPKTSSEIFQVPVLDAGYCLCLCITSRDHDLTHEDLRDLGLWTRERIRFGPKIERMASVRTLIQKSTNKNCACSAPIRLDIM